MKLNFDYCKICNANMKWFKLTEDGILCFNCTSAGYFILDIQNYELKFKSKHVLIDQITEEEWKDIKEMNITTYYEEKFKGCTYKLEHILEEEE